MLINTEQMISMSEANQNFSKVARMVDQEGQAIILKNNVPRYLVIEFSQAEQEQKAAQEQMQEQIARARVEIRRELEAQAKEKSDQQNRELVMIGEELERLNERFLLLKNKVKALTEEEQTENEE